MQCSLFLGEDKIIYLPHNSIILSGNLSTDDHAITTWEWTKSADDAQKAVDMQDTRTPYLKLSNLEEGMYTFTLKVTDSANQSSTAQVSRNRLSFVCLTNYDNKSLEIPVYYHLFLNCSLNSLIKAFNVVVLCCFIDFCVVLISFLEYSVNIFLDSKSFLIYLCSIIQGMQVQNAHDQ